MNLCNTVLGQAIGASNCNTNAVEGLEQVGYIMNRADVDLATVAYETTDPNKLKTFTMLSSKKPVAIYQPKNNPFEETGSSLESGKYINTFTNTVKFVILGSSSGICKSIDELANGEFVVVVENKQKVADDSTEARYQVYGLKQGLKCTEATESKYDEDLLGGWSVTLTETKCPTSGIYMPKTIFESLTTNTSAQAG